MTRAGPTTEPLPVLLVVADAGDQRGTRRLLRLATWMAASPDVELGILIWLSGERRGDFAALALTVDAGRAHERLFPRLLMHLGLGRLGRALKDRSIGRAIQAMPAPRVLYLGAPSASTMLEWLPRRPPVVAAQVGEADLPAPGTGIVGRVAHGVDPDLVVATDPEAVAWLEASGLSDDRILRCGLLDGPSRPPSSGCSVAPVAVGLWGWEPSELAPFVSRLGILAPRGVEIECRWFGEERLAWPLWQGAGAATLAGRVRIVEPSRLVDEVASLAVLVTRTGSLTDADVLLRARLAGVRVVELDPGDVDRAVAACVERVDAGAGDRPRWDLTAEEGGPALVSTLRRLDDRARRDEALGALETP